MHGYFVTKGAMARTYGSRGGRAVASTRTYCIEGEYVRMEDIAARLGVHYDTASHRLRRERAGAETVTWAGLAVGGGHR